MEEETPYTVIWCHHSMSFRAWNQHFNYRRMDSKTVARKEQEVCILIAFAIQIFEMLLGQERHFLHEHPAIASSRELSQMRTLPRRSGVGICART